MVSFRGCAVAIAAVLSLNSSNVSAFSVPGAGRSLFAQKSGSRAVLGPKVSPSTKSLRMAEDSDPVFIPTVLKKEIVYDEATGRFFETGFGEGDCVPDEEFCMTDKESGEMIRLTVEEKERIFLDALQVSSLRC